MHGTQLSAHCTLHCVIVAHTFSTLKSNWLPYGCSQPADKYPDMFSQTGLFGRFPFALPTMIAAVLSLVGTHGSHCCTLHSDMAELVLALLRGSSVFHAVHATMLVRMHGPCYLHAGIVHFSQA